MSNFVCLHWTCLVLLSLSLQSLTKEQFDRNEEIVVRTRSGKVAGKSKRTETGREVVSYLGIPFATPPVGDLRFKLPQEVKPWNETFQADKVAVACYQGIDETFKGFEGVEMWNPNTPISEDCLQLNMWVPKGAINVAVLVWIHGGGFYSGSSSLDVYNGEILAAEGDVIVVNINYRLGPFGFLYLDDDLEAAPGNLGLADQQFGMQWVKRNIDAFGGDSNKITIFGESAGAAAVSSHLFAENSWDFYRYAIFQSGSMIEPWANIKPDLAKNNTRKLAEILNCWRSSPRDTVSCLRNVPASILQEKSVIQSEGDNFFDLSFVPIRRDIHFFRGNVVEKLKSGDFKKSPILLGSTADESTYFLPYIFPNYFNITSEGLISKKDYVFAVNDIFQKFPRMIRNSIAFHYETSKIFATELPKYFPQPNEKSVFYRDSLSKVLSDYYFVCELIATADYLTQYGSTVYMYYFDDRSELNPWPVWMGSMHGYEIGYVFGSPLRRPDSYSQREIDFSKKVIYYWTNFAKFGCVFSCSVFNL